MPNNIPAAAEGLPEINRRTALAMLSGGVVAAATTVTLASPPPPPTSLHDALAACYAAENEYRVCDARESSIAETLGENLFPKWTAPGGGSSIWSHRPTLFRTSASLEAEIARKHAGIEASYAQGGMNKRAYDRWKRTLEAQGTEGLAALREQEAAIVTSGHTEASRLTDEAFERVRTAFYAVLVHPCQNLQEVRVKAACLLRVYNLLGLEIDGGDLAACLTSLCEEA